MEKVVIVMPAWNEEENISKSKNKNGEIYLKRFFRLINAPQEKNIRGIEV